MFSKGIMEMLCRFRPIRIGRKCNTKQICLYKPSLFLYISWMYEISNRFRPIRIGRNFFKIQFCLSFRFSPLYSKPLAILNQCPKKQSLFRNWFKLLIVNNLGLYLTLEFIYGFWNSSYYIIVWIEVENILLMCCS